MNICVFCSANELDRKYTDAGAEFAQLLASHGHTLIWGGEDHGLMKVIADGVQKGGGKIIGIAVEEWKSLARLDADEMVITRDLAERKALMIARGDVIVTMPGGTGTLDEAATVLGLKRHLLPSKPFVILNTDNFYEGLKIQLERMERDSFLIRPLDEYVCFANTPEDAVAFISRCMQ